MRSVSSCFLRYKRFNQFHHRRFTTSAIDLSNKVAIITGAESGIGRATAKLFSDHNANVIGIGLNEDQLKSLKDEINCDLFTANCTNQESVQHYMQAIFDKYKSIDILCNIAGGFKGSSTIPFHLRDIQSINDTLNNNLFNVILNCHSVIPYMLETVKNDNNNGCSIVNMSSQLTEISVAGYADYNTSKHGIIGLTKSLCAEYGSSNIRCNSVHPGPTNTSSLKGQNIEALKSNIPIGRIGEPDEIAQMFLWLASDHSLYVNGSKFVIDGGFSNQCSFYPSSYMNDTSLMQQLTN